MRFQKYSPYLFLFLLVLFSQNSVIAQTEKKKSEKKEMTKFNTVEERKGVKLRVVPGPMYDPSIKFGLFVAPMLTYYPSKGDTISPVSMTSFYGMYTTNKSYIAGFNNELYLKEDTWRIRVRAGGGGLNKDISVYNVYDNTLDVDTTNITTADAKQIVFQFDSYLMRRVYNKLYMGLGYNYKKIDFEGNTSRADTLVQANGLTGSSGNNGVAYKMDFDTRDNVNYPYKGYFLSYTGYQYFNSGGKSNAYFANLIKIMGFWSINKNSRHVIAAKVYANLLAGNPEVANFSYYGRVNGDVQRGYQSGRRVDKNALNIEIEYRWTTPLLDNRLRFMGLLGNGKVFGYYNDFTDAEWLPVVGVGVRYAILPYERINIRLDTTYSKDGFIWYFGIREAF
ncbi:BamA/TamA family outer membrane protein [Flammeovirga kamogawensis]|uniref:Outer membrane protein assembly factor n=1 Tax=Flammeovirga kamogawensis TaxID=373891 RepID=A0ABX8GZ77_9BACT|nr:BamA/TamA family outer membrane protein [Flammeovirga kamogawensis]MBB6459362.1 hypothetical protein [Flammeovirga kamogawensis]QWG08919.1 outer membrane protein assembly factor [Flammeovirga kamogawensis]TRX67210.1 BamA/TamA family outer membrane protein [Flammeovirga kamogawensis]